MHPDGGAVQVDAGRYGPYVKWDKVNATLPKELSPEAVTLEEALELVAEKAGKGGKAQGRRARPRPSRLLRSRRPPPAEESQGRQAKAAKAKAVGAKGPQPKAASA